MEKKRSATAVVTEGQAQAALRKGALRALDKTEESVLRMRLGASLPGAAPLTRVELLSDAQIELLSYEIEAYLELRARGLAPRRRARAAAAPAKAPPRTVAPAAVPERKAKILSALKRKR
ncbi:hypothetical protein [Anaeromyxobacter paludicola]|uniref:Terminase small subunit n=1 Tax=Anaeromyxobacter paludicola TaxID=2918171 RepID=A0ABN6NC08_9BACT|nr:hypothetical protein [Anaeromyxobacter paludicola]BDG09540.1 hypothetical protein AMPC_26530 [Anaeromyxobacter paludicola]